MKKGDAGAVGCDALKRSAAFSGIELKACAGMDNHFHVVCKVVRTDEPIPESELLRRVAILKGEKAADDLAEHWQELRSMGLSAMVDTAQDRLRGRMNDISEFIKTFKEVFNIRFKQERLYAKELEDVVA